MTYRSTYEDAEGNIQSYGEPLMNDSGIMSVIGQVQSVVNRITVMSNLDDKEIQGLIMLFADTLIIDLLKNRLRYDIKDPVDRNKILSTGLMTVYICLKRPYKEGDRRFWKGSVQEIKQDINAPNKSKGLLSSLMP